MKKFLVCFVFLVAMSALGITHFWRGKVLSASEVGRRWGQAELDVEKFRVGDPTTRASMAFSLLKKQKEFQGTFVVDLRKKLGDPDGFYFSDVFPAYLIQEGTSRKEETWQIVFLLNKERKVEDIIVHKNCCDD